MGIVADTELRVTRAMLLKLRMPQSIVWVKSQLVPNHQEKLVPATTTTNYDFLSKQRCPVDDISMSLYGI